MKCYINAKPSVHTTHGTSTGSFSLTSESGGGAFENRDIEEMLDSKDRRDLPSETERSTMDDIAEFTIGNTQLKAVRSLRCTWCILYRLYCLNSFILNSTFYILF